MWGMRIQQKCGSTVSVHASLSITMIQSHRPLLELLTKAANLQQRCGLKRWNGVTMSTR